MKIRRSNSSLWCDGLGVSEAISSLEKEARLRRVWVVQCLLYMWRLQDECISAGRI